MIEYRFNGKVALVTGSSRGIGASILSAFVKAGAVGILHYWDDEEGANRRDAESLASSLGGVVHLIAADVRSMESVAAMMQTVRSTVGKIDILVNNAGIIRDRTMRKMEESDWHVVMETNLDGVFFTCKQALDLLNDGGRIVNISSISGIVGFHGQANYSAAKAGVIALTKVLAKELARRGITVNAIAPGVIRTTMLDALKPEVLDEYVKQIPVGRLGKPEDIANAVLFLSSEESGYITGQVIPITGGWF